MKQASEKTKAFLFVFAFSVSGCGAFLQSTQTDIAQGKEVAKQVEAESGTLDDDSRTLLVQEIGQRLLSHYEQTPFKFSFQIVDQSEPNAFAAPGGFIYASRGLLALSNSEDELAGVMAHEIIHVGQRHTAKQNAKARLPGLLMLPGQIVGVVAPAVGALVTVPFAVLGGGYIASHSREHEHESDRLGEELAAKSGYDPFALAAILTRLEQSAELDSGKKREAGFFDTHPMTPSRVSDIEKRAGELHYPRQPGIRASRADYLHALEGLVIGENPQNGVCRDNGQFLHPDLDLFVSFPSQWLLANSRSGLGVLAPDKKALMALSVAEKGTDPAAPAKQLIAELEKEQRWQPSREEPTTVNGLPAYLVEYRQRSSRGSLVLGVLFIAHQDLIFGVLWLTPGQHEKVQKEAAYTFRPLTADERASITETRLHIVEASNDETLTALSQRTTNIWSPDQTAVINGINRDAPLTAGALIKIARRHAYQPN